MVPFLHDRFSLYPAGNRGTTIDASVPELKIQEQDLQNEKVPSFTIFVF